MVHLGPFNHHFGLLTSNSIRPIWFIRAAFWSGKQLLNLTPHVSRAKTHCSVVPQVSWKISLAPIRSSSSLSWWKWLVELTKMVVKWGDNRDSMSFNGDSYNDSWGINWENNGTKLWYINGMIDGLPSMLNYPIVASNATKQWDWKGLEVAFQDRMNTVCRTMLWSLYSVRCFDGKSPEFIPCIGFLLALDLVYSHTFTKLWFSIGFVPGSVVPSRGIYSLRGMDYQ